MQDALVEFGERQLGCRGISPIWLSCYVNGCRQGLHADAPHGPFAFVLSLTRWDERRFSGGETLLLQPHVLDYWRSFDSGVGTEMPQLVSAGVVGSAGQAAVPGGREFCVWHCPLMRLSASCSPRCRPRSSSLGLGS